MKNLLMILLTIALALSLTACGAGNTDSPGGEQISVANARELLNTVWDSYGEDERFPAAGGDMSEENMTMDAPGKFGIEDADILDATLGFPAAFATKIDDAASLMHMLNANTFTCGAYHVKNTEDISELASKIKDNIQQRQWLCGFPDKLVIISLGNYLVVFFGETEIVDSFQAKLNDAYPSAEVVCAEPIG